ncbi:amidohydrolase family protein [Hyphomonas sp. WL0036]|uniref:amidohydrolase family protein n=1 Tax=Hyphomonas sediminis TaxID=2866160 RepID=UPI001C81F090|nr:amidohydrolase family protein [Hyphomonas sediminis]MBY9068077.1 amidohydrolase family protein [Hyphomonas sediminis]
MPLKKEKSVLRLFSVLLLATVCLIGQQFAFAKPGQVTAITNVEVFDATGAAPWKGTVLIRDGRIIEAGPKVKTPRGAKVIKGEGRALLPGFYDVHTHWGPRATPSALPHVSAAYLAAGVTTVLDFHQPPEAFQPRREWLEAVPSPHVNLVARMSTPGGHGADWSDQSTTKWVSTPESAERAVQELLPYKPDYIKVFSDGWRYGMSPEETSMNEETLSALADEAHENNIRILTHTVTSMRGALAARAGVDIIAHSLQDRALTAEEAAEIAASGVFYAPTLAIYEPRRPGAPELDMESAAVRQRVWKYGIAEENLRTLFAAGVPVALGTDAGIGGLVHGDATLREIELFVAAGLSPTDALIAATATSARALGLAEDRGQIAAGQRADLVLIKGKPWETISDVRNISLTLVDGVVLYDAAKPPAALPAMPAPRAAAALIDDFERADGRTSVDSLPVTDLDFGMERSVITYARRPREEGDHVLTVTAQMARKDKPMAGVIFPLSRGSVVPVDATAYAGVTAELFGSGDYTLRILSLNGNWEAKVTAGEGWNRFEVPFTDFAFAGNPESAPAWSGDDLLQVGIMINREGGESAWFEVDNIGFYPAQ